MRHHTRFIFIVIILALFIFLFPRITEDAREDRVPAIVIHNTEAMDAIAITPIQHASFFLDWADTRIYVDPAEGSYDGLSVGDIVLITDVHPDHFSTDTLAKIVGARTLVIAPRVVAEKIPSSLTNNVLILANGQSVEPSGFKIETIPMYNFPETPDAYHVKGRGNGYIVEKGDVRMYIAGDTGPIPEMAALQNIDIAFIPMNLPYTMTVGEAAKAVLSFIPARVYPYHYRGMEGLSDVQAFADLVKKGSPYIDVIQENWYPTES